MFLRTIYDERKYWREGQVKGREVLVNYQRWKVGGEVRVIEETADD